MCVLFASLGVYLIRGFVLGMATVHSEKTSRLAQECQKYRSAPQT